MSDMFWLVVLSSKVFLRITRQPEACRTFLCKATPRVRDESFTFSEFAVGRCMAADLQRRGAGAKPCEVGHQSEHAGNTQSRRQVYRTGNSANRARLAFVFHHAGRGRPNPDTHYRSRRATVQACWQCQRPAPCVMEYKCQ